MSLLFLILIVQFYQGQLERERSQVSSQVNRLLQVSLENAMVKRDIPGLTEIVRRLGQDEQVTGVMIVNPLGEVRFSSDPSMIGHKFNMARDETCKDCHQAGGVTESLTRFTLDEQGREVLRSVNPVYNKPICQSCHGALSDHPINGILFVDYNGHDIKKEAFHGSLVMVGSGGLVVLLTLLGAWWMINRHILVPVARISKTARIFSNGQLDARVSLEGQDELAELGGSFDTMAEMLQRNWRQQEENKAFLKSLINAMPDGVRVIDENFSVIMANQAYCRQIGLEHSAVEGSPCYLSHGLDHPCPPTLVTCPMHEISEVTQHLKCLHRHQTTDGEELFVEISAAQIAPLTKDGNARLIVEVIRDLSHQMSLSHEHKLSELGQLATGVAHEIHNPLASARLSVQAMLRQIERNTFDIPEMKEYLRILDSEIDACVHVTNRLLKLSGTPENKPQLVSLNTSVFDMVSLLAYEAQATHIQVNVKMERDDLRLMATESEMRMLVLNMIQNAFHAMPKGGQLLILGKTQDDDIMIRFEDNGVGIPPENMPYITNPFFSHRADGIRGTGLGLAICKMIIERYRGKLKVESDVDKGTRVTVRFPNPDMQEYDI